MGNDYEISVASSTSSLSGENLDGWLENTVYGYTSSPTNNVYSSYADYAKQASTSGTGRKFQHYYWWSTQNAFASKLGIVSSNFTPDVFIDQSTLQPAVCTYYGLDPLLYVPYINDYLTSQFTARHYALFYVDQNVSEAKTWGDYYNKITCYEESYGDNQWRMVISFEDELHEIIVVDTTSINRNKAYMYLRVTITDNTEPTSPTATYRYIYYGYNTGHPELDALFASEIIQTNTYLPPIPLRIDKKFISTTQYSDYYDLCKTATAKLTDTWKPCNEYEDIQDIIADSEDVGDINYAYIVPAVNLRTNISKEIEYLYKFFENLYINESVSKGIVPGTVVPYSTWLAAAGLLIDTNCDSSSLNIFEMKSNTTVNWHGAVSWGSCGLFTDNLGNPNKVRYNPLYKKYLKYKRTHQDSTGSTWSWGGETYTSIPSRNISSASEVNDYWIEASVENGYATVVQTDSEGYPVSYYDEDKQCYVTETYTTPRDFPVMKIYHKVSDTTYDFIAISNASFSTIIYKDGISRSSLWQVFDIASSYIRNKNKVNNEADRDNFLVPIQINTFKELSVYSRCQVASNSLWIVVHAYKVEKVRWYQDLIGIVVAIIGAILTVYGQGWIGIPLMVLGATMLFCEAIIMVLIDIFGEKWGMILYQVISSVVKIILSVYFGPIGMASAAAISAGESYVNRDWKGFAINVALMFAGSASQFAQDYGLDELNKINSLNDLEQVYTTGTELAENFKVLSQSTQTLIKTTNYVSKGLQAGSSAYSMYESYRNKDWVGLGLNAISAGAILSSGNGAFSNTNLKLDTATIVSKVGELATTATNSYLQTELQEEAKDAYEQMEAIEEELEEVQYNLVKDKYKLKALNFICLSNSLYKSESPSWDSPEVFLARTLATGSDIADMTLQGLTFMIDMTISTNSSV